MDKVIHFEIPVDNLERAKNFYKSAFSWNLIPIPDLQYTILHTVEVDELNMPKESGAINGGMMQRSEKIRSPVITIGVQNIDEAIKKIESLGGKVLQGKMEVPNMGLMAYVQDTEDNIVGLWQDIKR